MNKAIILILCFLMVLLAACEGKVVPTATPDSTATVGSSPTPAGEVDEESAIVPATEQATPVKDTTTEITAVPFDLGVIPLVQTGEVPDRTREMPTYINGLIAAPATGDNLPIAIIIHGNHPSGCPSDGLIVEWPCPGEELPHYTGFRYLVEALAEQGYVAVSINVVPAYVSAYGEPNPSMRLSILFDNYLNQLAAAVNGEDVDFGVDLAGRVDWSKLVVLGHSASGEIVVNMTDSRAGHTNPEQIAAGDGPIAGAILLAPAVISTEGMEMNTPFAVILPACDRDLGGLPGQKYYELARMDPVRAFPALSVYVKGANHNRFSSELEDETLGGASIDCEGEDALLSAEQHRQFLADFTTQFFDWVLNAGQANPVAIGLDAAQPAPDELLGVPVLTSLSLPVAQRMQLDVEPDGAVGSATAVACEAGFTQAEENVEPCRRLQFNQPGEPAELAVQWDGADGALQVDLPQVHSDLTQFDEIHLRAVIDPLSELNPPGEPQAFSLRLTDGTGHAAELSLAAEPALAFPAGEAWNDGFTDLWDNKVLLSSIRVPLAAFETIDLADVRTISLVFDQTNTGAIFVTDLELLRTG